MVILGTGSLDWPRSERVSNRYGTVNLWDENDGQTYPIDASAYVGQRGVLEFRVRKVRESPHIGDFFRGLFPTMPEVGEFIILGKGQLFVEGGLFDDGSIGLMPDDGRDSDWLDPESLYRAHYQIGDLVFHPNAHDPH